MGSKAWIVRIVLLLYIIYKSYTMVVYPPDDAPLMNIDNSSPGAYAGSIVAMIIVGLLLAYIVFATLYYQISQGYAEFANRKLFEKRKFRLSSVIIYFVFFVLIASSVFIKGILYPDLYFTYSYWINFYTLFSMVAVLIAAWIVWRDFNMYLKARTQKTK